MALVNIKDSYINELAIKGINPTQFVNQLLDQHFEPWNYSVYENEMIDKVLVDLKPTPDDLQIIRKYLTYHILKDFKQRMTRRYERSLPMYSLEYYMKRLSIAVVERSFNVEKVEKYYGELLADIKSKDPDFNLQTYVDNMIRLRYLPNSQRKVIAKVEQLENSDPMMKKIQGQYKRRNDRMNANKKRR